MSLLAGARTARRGGAGDPALFEPCYGKRLRARRKRSTNAWFLVGDVPALIGTDYGRLLLVKLGVFAAMLGLAVTNRGVLTPRLAAGDRAALPMLRRTAVLEIAAGIGVVLIVAVLGVTVPAAHQPPVWPFDHTLSWQPIQQSAWMQVAVAAAGLSP